MYSKQEAAQLRKEFWTVFGQYLSPIPSSEGEKINWINYKTGVKGLQFKMHADKHTASIGIAIIHPNLERQKEIFQQLVDFKESLHGHLQEEWNWLLHTQDDHGATVSRIYKEKTGVSIFQKDKWPELVSFFKPRLIALDQFWNSVKYGFEGWQQPL